MDEHQFDGEMAEFLKELNAFEQKVKKEVANKLSVPEENGQTADPSSEAEREVEQWLTEQSQVPPQAESPQQRQVQAPSQNHWFEPQTQSPVQPQMPIDEPTMPVNLPPQAKEQEAPYTSVEEFFSEDVLPEEPLPQETRENKKQAKKKKPRKKWSKTKKILMSIICVLLALLLAGGGFLWSKLSLINTGGEDWEEVDTMEDDIDAATIDSITDASSLTAWLKAWHNNGGDHMSSKYVKNILLLGVDSDSSLSDTMMLVSVNRKTKKISMVSFYRDSYTYVKRKNGKDSFTKLNAAYSYGGAELVRSTIENNYKIKIDEYALVDYDSFPKVIDALGGVTVNVTEKEAAYLNKTWWKWSRTGNKISFTAGDMKMDGEHALMYCRIRKLDSDVNRTERQRKVIDAIIDKAQDATVSQLNSMVNTVFPYVTTSMTKTKIISYGTQALSESWINWPRTQATMPTDDYCLPGYAGTQWIWLCDYEGSAYELQMQLYGKSNISLAKNRVSPLSFSSSYSENTTSASTKKSSGSTGNSSTRSYSTKSSTTNFGDDLIEELSGKQQQKSTSSTTAKATSSNSSTTRRRVF